MRRADCHPDKRHMAFGLCRTCYNRRYWNLNRSKSSCPACIENGKKCRECRKRYQQQWEQRNFERRSAEKRDWHQANRVLRPRKKPIASTLRHGNELVRVAVKGWGYLIA